MRKILFITGTRADFGKLKSLMSVTEISEEFELHVLVTGMHMMKLYGSTYKEVKKENYKKRSFQNRNPFFTLYVFTISKLIIPLILFQT